MAIIPPSRVCACRVHTVRCCKKVFHSDSYTRFAAACEVIVIKAENNKRYFLARRQLDRFSSPTEKYVLPPRFRKARQSAPTTILQNLNRWLQKRQCIPRGRAVADLCNFVCRIVTKLARGEDGVFAFPRRRRRLTMFDRCRYGLVCHTRLLL